jgi:hypothetical protein
MSGSAFSGGEKIFGGGERPDAGGIGIRPFREVFTCRAFARATTSCANAPVHSSRRFRCGRESSDVFSICAGG